LCGEPGKTPGRSSGAGRGVSEQPLQPVGDLLIRPFEQIPVRVESRPHGAGRHRAHGGADMARSAALAWRLSVRAFGARRPGAIGSYVAIR
jgi:hypothetical protein